MASSFQRIDHSIDHRHFPFPFSFQKGKGNGWWLKYSLGHVFSKRRLATRIDRPLVGLKPSIRPTICLLKRRLAKESFIEPPSRSPDFLSFPSQCWAQRMKEYNKIRAQQKERKGNHYGDLTPSSYFIFLFFIKETIGWSFVFLNFY